MKLCTFHHGEATRIGVVSDDGVADLSVAAPELPGEMIALLAAGPGALRRASSAASNAKSRLALDSLRLAAPILRPPKLLAIGLNYADHVAEAKLETPKFPTVFTKLPTSVTGPFDDVHLPRVSSMLDYEGELGFVIGRRCRHVPKTRAHEVIAGYLVHDDVSVRDWQMRVSQWTMGKAFDTHAPLGPWLTTADEIDTRGLALRTWVNGELRQDSSTRNLIFDCAAIVEHVSTVCTLEPGDVIVTGTPGGVGAAMKPARFLAAGDVVRVEIEGIGAIENRVIAEPDTALI